MRSVRVIIVACAAALAACDGSPTSETGHAPKLPSRHAIALTEMEIAKLGIETVPALATKYVPQVHGYGFVVNTTELAQLDAAIVTTAASQRQSLAALKRARILFGKPGAVHAVSNEALDAAEQRAAADEAALALASSSEVAAFGQNAPWRGMTRNSELVAKLTSGRAMLVEATFPLGVSLGTVPTSLTVTPLAGQHGHSNWNANKIWNAPANPTIPGRSFFALVNGTDLEQGEHVFVFAPTGKPITGVRVPKEAVILSEDKAWCYAEVAPHTFLRVLLDLSLPLEDGYFVARGISKNQAVVVGGTGLLLARETGPTPTSQY